MKKLSVFTVFFLLCLSMHAQPSETFTIPPRWVHWISDPDFVRENQNQNIFNIFEVMDLNIVVKDGYCYPHYLHRDRHNDHHGAAIQKIRISDGKLEWTNLYNHRNLPEHQLSLHTTNINENGNLELIGFKRVGSVYPARPDRPWVFGASSVPFMMELDQNTGAILRTKFEEVEETQQIAIPTLNWFFKSRSSEEGLFISNVNNPTMGLGVMSTSLDENFNYYQNSLDSIFTFDTMAPFESTYSSVSQIGNRISQELYSTTYFSVNFDIKEARAYQALYQYDENPNQIVRKYVTEFGELIPTDVVMNSPIGGLNAGYGRVLLSGRRSPDGAVLHEWWILFDENGQVIKFIPFVWAEGTQHPYIFKRIIHATDERIYFTGWPSVTGKSGLDFFSLNMEGEIKNYGSMIHEGNYLTNRPLGAVMTEEGDIALMVSFALPGTTESYYGMVGYRAEDFGIDDLRVSTQDVEAVRPQAYELSPNPAQTEVSIRRVGVTAGGNVELSITDLSGRMLRNQKLSCEGSCTLDVSELSAGMYILQIQSPTGQIAETHKLSIIR